MPDDSAGSEFEVRTADWLEPAEALARVLHRVPPLDVERVPLADALGRALSEDLVARATLPPWDNSAMDGYAVRGEDVTGASPSGPVTLRVTGQLRAGDTPTVSVGEGEAVRIMTGAPLPLGADTVVRVEDTDAEAEPGSVSIRSDRDRGRNVRPAGQDMQLGEHVASAGDAVRPGTVATLAALGYAEVPVRRRPTVALLATGDELRGPDAYDDVRAGAGVPESNGPMVAAQLRAAGGAAQILDVARDEPAEIRARVEAAADADALVTLGGASMGEADLVKRVLDEMGFRLDFWRVRMRPGSPFSFGWLPRGDREQPVFGLPGNPASAFVTFELFVRPFVLRMAGHGRVLRRTLRCVAGADLRGTEGLTHYLRVTIDSEASPPAVSTTGPQGSGLVHSLRAAEGLAIVPPDGGAVAQGAPVDVLLLEDAPGALEHPRPERAP